MPNCFQLTRIGEQEPIALAKLDNEICQHCGAEPHPTKYYMWWFDIIGFKLAMGRSFAEIRESLVANYSACDDDDNDTRQHYRELIKINDYLSTNFVAKTFVEIGKR